MTGAFGISTYDGAISCSRYYDIGQRIARDVAIQILECEDQWRKSGENPMCDYSLHAVASRPARVGEKLVTTSFRGTSTRGFAAKEEPGVAVCLLPGTELAFEHEVKYNRYWLLTRSTDFCVARFCAIEPRGPDQHHDALAFPDGNTVLVNMLSEGQHARVLQLPVIRQGQNVDAHAQRTVILALDPEVTA
jgi:hypothetical protein